ncbi:unnamed protein product [Arabis nemorensis]|uniref:Uncharacterized protein n=1 Tax=Arabis nemorensis TaxID=586526 RepID=A0A565C7B6_9BRAS|nr:unnamed protein product [Arabis nemorensis]
METRTEGDTTGTAGAVFPTARENSHRRSSLENREDDKQFTKTKNWVSTVYGLGCDGTDRWREA